MKLEFYFNNKMGIGGFIHVWGFRIGNLSLRLEWVNRKKVLEVVDKYLQPLTKEPPTAHPKQEEFVWVVEGPKGIN